MLEVTGLHVAYGGIQAVRSITFHVNEGETVEVRTVIAIIESN